MATLPRSENVRSGLGLRCGTMTQFGPAACLCLVLGSSCSSPVPVTDAGFPIRFDTSSWSGLVDNETLNWLIELRKAQLGESADLDGDGAPAS